MANRLLSNIQSPNRATPLATITPFTPWRRVTPTLPVSRQCTRPWPDLCCTGPLKDSTLVCSLMVKQDLENHTREWLLLFYFFSTLFLLLPVTLSHFNLKILFCRMMGFGEESGVIPRFCCELFSRMTSIENNEVKSQNEKTMKHMENMHKTLQINCFALQVKCHLEMSYFEVYNEKIHDLLVTRDEPNQRRMPVSGSEDDRSLFNIDVAFNLLRTK